jgi:hypothetical protein
MSLGWLDGILACTCCACVFLSVHSLQTIVCRVYRHERISGVHARALLHLTVHTRALLHLTVHIRALLHLTVHIRALLHLTVHIRALLHLTVHTRALLHLTVHTRALLHLTVHIRARMLTCTAMIVCGNETTCTLKARRTCSSMIGTLTSEKNENTHKRFK